MTMEFAGDRPPRYDKKRFLSHRGGLSPALREEIETRGLSYREDIKTRRALLPQEVSPTEHIEI